MPLLLRAQAKSSSHIIARRTPLPTTDATRPAPPAPPAPPASLLETFRQKPETWQVVVFSGFDPDLSTSGLGHAVVQISSHGRKRLERVECWELKRSGKATGIDAANAMTETIHAHAELFVAHQATVESQQLYPDPNMTRRELVAKGNDLLMLALVSGAAVELYHRARCDVTAMLPRQWKGQRSKEAMRPELLRIVGDTPQRVNGTDGLSIATAGSHAMDALMMALRRAGYHV